MTEMNAGAYRKAEADFKAALRECAPLLSVEALKDVKHYVENAELELAYESLILSLNEECVLVPPVCKKLLYPMADLLGITQDGVLIGTSWPSLSRIIKP
jgi:hypothetical protein